MKTLLLLRHAKSDWSAPYGQDHERPLNERGLRSARLVGRMLRDLGIQPQLAVSSTAIRARSTVEIAADSGAWDCPIVLDRSLYELGPDGVLERASTAPEVERLMLVGHQPTWSMLVHQITGSSADMKTASVAEISLPVESWSQLPRSTGTLASLHHARSYFGSEWDVQGSGS